jgi:CHAT domain-containing protein
MFSDLEPLPATAREIDEASALYSRRTVLIDTAPNRASVLRELSKHDVVHFAAHARIIDDNPGASHLVLAKQPGGFAKNVLFASEIAAMRLNRVQLLILSACGSPGAAFSHVTSNGLAEAFLDAGVRQVIANDWEADDEATAVLSTKLHRELRSGLASDDALRRAQVALLRGGSKRLASPSVWSGFRLIVAAW